LEKKNEEISGLKLELEKARSKNDMLNVILRQNDDSKRNSFGDVYFSY